MIKVVVRYIHIIALFVLMGAVWFDKDIPLSIVLLASVGPIIDLIGQLYSERSERLKYEERALRFEADIKELKDKVSNILLAKQMRGFE